MLRVEHLKQSSLWLLLCFYAHKIQFNNKEPMCILEEELVRLCVNEKSIGRSKRQVTLCLSFFFHFSFCFSRETKMSRPSEPFTLRSFPPPRKWKRRIFKVANFTRSLHCIGHRLDSLSSSNAQVALFKRNVRSQLSSQKESQLFFSPLLAFHVTIAN